MGTLTLHSALRRALHPALKPVLLPLAGALAAAAIAALLGGAAGGVVIPVAVYDWPYEEQRIPVGELLLVCAAMCGAVLLWSRFWEWERLGGNRTRVRAAAVASVGMLLPVAAATAVLPTVGPEASHPWLMVTNVLLASACVYALAPLVGPVRSGLLVLVGIFLGAALCNMVPELARVTPYAYVHSDGWTLPSALPWQVMPVLGLVAGLAAVAVHAVTRGASPRVGRSEPAR